MSQPIIAIDARMAFSSGIGTYLRGLLSEIPNLLDHETLSIIGNHKAASTHIRIACEVNSSIYSVQEQFTIPRACRTLSATLLHSPHYNVPFQWIDRSVVTVHDLIHLKFPQFLPSVLARGYAHFFFRTLIPRARAILTVSEHTKKDLMEMLHIPESRITVTYPGASAQFHLQKPEDVSAAVTAYGLQKGYFLFVGNLKPFKNVQFLAKTYRLLKEQFRDAPRMVFIGRNFIPGFEAEMDRAGVRWLKEVAPETLPALYSGALGLVFPSLYEGFGLPPLEAMACGVPVICSNSASLPEVVGDAGLMIDPYSNDSLLEAMRRLMQDADLQKDLAARGLARARMFSWKTLAEKTLSVYRQCLN